MTAAVQQATNMASVEGAEELAFQAEESGEMPEKSGFLPGSTGKHYVFVPQNSTLLSQKCTEQFSEKLQPKEQKTQDSKQPLKESKQEITEKHDVRVIKEGKSLSKETKQPTYSRANQTAQQTLDRFKPAAAHTTPMQLYSEKKGEKRADQRNTPSERGVKQDKKNGETRQQEKTAPREQNQQTALNHPREQEKADRKQEEQTRRDDQEEGFAENEHREQNHENPDGNEEHTVGVIENIGNDLKACVEYANSDSSLSEIFNMRISQFDVLLLFFEVMKLSLKGREQERLARNEERSYQLEHIQEMIDNIKHQGKWQFFSSLGAGIFTIAAGVMPIVGYMKGDWIVDKLGGIFSSIQGMKKDAFTDFARTMFEGFSEMQKSTGQIQNTFAESSRVYHEKMNDIRRTDESERTRTMDELRDEWKSIEQFLHQSLQMHHDAIRQLYS